MTAGLAGFTATALVAPATRLFGAACACPCCIEAGPSAIQVPAMMRGCVIAPELVSNSGRATEDKSDESCPVSGNIAGGVDGEATDCPDLSDDAVATIIPTATIVRNDARNLREAGRLLAMR